MKNEASDPALVKVRKFVEGIDHAGRREDAVFLLDIYSDALGSQPRMCGQSIIGFGEYDYKRADGSEHSFALAAFSPRKSNMVIYLVSGCANHTGKLAGLGPHKTAVSCLYLGRLAKIDAKLLGEIIADDVAIMRKRYPASVL